MNFGVRANGAPAIQDQSFSLNEGAPVGLEVGTVIASDADLGQTIHFSIIGGTGQNLFSDRIDVGRFDRAESPNLTMRALP